jgi:hypothetical protein
MNIQVQSEIPQRTAQALAALRARQAGANLALVVVQATPVEVRPLTKHDDAVIQHVERTLADCILPAGGMLVPTVYRIDHRMVFLVVACGDEKSIDVVFRRIGEQLAALDTLQTTGLEVVVSHTSAAVPVDTAELLPDDGAEAAAKAIEQLIEKHISGKP